MRPIGVQSKCITFVVGVDTLDQHLSTDGPGNPIPGNLYSVNISWTGATVGDEIFIYDTATVAGDITANKLFSFRIPTAAGSFPAGLPAVGKRAYKGMWLHPILGGGAFNIDLGISNGNG